MGGGMKNFLKPLIELRRGYKSPKHLGKVAEIPCMACRIEPAPRARRLNLHHLCGIGAGQKASDLLVLPLCEFHHQVGGVGHAIHAGVEIWEEKFGTQQSLILEIHAKLGIEIYKNFLEGK